MKAFTAYAIDCVEQILNSLSSPVLETLVLEAQEGVDPCQTDVLEMLDWQAIERKLQGWTFATLSKIVNWGKSHSDKLTPLLKDKSLGLYKRGLFTLALSFLPSVP